MLDDLRTIFRRDLEALRNEVLLYPDDLLLWRVLPGCPNSGGTLALHLVGNLRHFIGAQLGETGYVRNRTAEFESRDIARGDLATLVSTAQSEVDNALAGLSPDDLSGPSMAPVGDGSLSTGLWILHLAGHLDYHIGQINYHRRTLTGDGAPTGGVLLKNLLDH